MSDQYFIYPNICNNDKYLVIKELHDTIEYQPQSIILPSHFIDQTPNININIDDNIVSIWYLQCINIDGFDTNIKNHLECLELLRYTLAKEIIKMKGLSEFLNTMAKIINSNSSSDKTNQLWTYFWEIVYLGYNSGSLIPGDDSIDILNWYILTKPYLDKSSEYICKVILICIQLDGDVPDFALTKVISEMAEICLKMDSFTYSILINYSETPNEELKMAVIFKGIASKVKSHESLGMDEHLLRDIIGSGYKLSYHEMSLLMKACKQSGLNKIAKLIDVVLKMQIIIPLVPDTVNPIYSMPDPAMYPKFLKAFPLHWGVFIYNYAKEIQALQFQEKRHIVTMHVREAIEGLTESVLYLDPEYEVQVLKAWNYIFNPYVIMYLTNDERHQLFMTMHDRLSDYSDKLTMILNIYINLQIHDYTEKEQLSVFWNEIIRYQIPFDSNTLLIWFNIFSNINMTESLIEHGIELLSMAMDKKMIINKALYMDITKFIIKNYKILMEMEKYSQVIYQFLGYIRTCKK